MSVSFRNVAFALAGFFATAFTLTMPRPAAASGAESVGRVVGGFLMVFGIPLALRFIYVKGFRRGQGLRVMSGWVLVLACVMAFMVHGSGTPN